MGIKFTFQLLTFYLCFTYFESFEIRPQYELSYDNSNWIDSDSFANTNSVSLKVYYEAHCNDSRKFFLYQLHPVLLRLGRLIKLRTYPYGKATTKFVNGKYEFTCQHGQPECYGNKLHACVNSALRNSTAAALFNTCMMDFAQSGKGSDDTAADVCGSKFRINVDKIKLCAKNEVGTALLKRAGDITAMLRVGPLSYVPTVILNGKNIGDKNLLADICKVLGVTPVEDSNRLNYY